MAPGGSVQGAGAGVAGGESPRTSPCLSPRPTGTFPLRGIETFGRKRGEETSFRSLAWFHQSVRQRWSKVNSNSGMSLNEGGEGWVCMWLRRRVMHGAAVRPFEARGRRPGE